MSLVHLPKPIPMNPLSTAMLQPTVPTFPPKPLFTRPQYPDRASMQEHTTSSKEPHLMRGDRYDCWVHELESAGKAPSAKAVEALHHSFWLRMAHNHDLTPQELAIDFDATTQTITAVVNILIKDGDAVFYRHDIITAAPRMFARTRTNSFSPIHDFSKGGGLMGKGHVYRTTWNYDGAGLGLLMRGGDDFITANGFEYRECDRMLANAADARWEHYSLVGAINSVLKRMRTTQPQVQLSQLQQLPGAMGESLRVYLGI